MNEFDFSAITGQLIDALTIVLMAGVTWAVRTFQNKTKSDELKLVMDRLGDTVKNGVAYSMSQAEEILLDKVRVSKTKNALVNSAIEYVLMNSPDLIKKSGYSNEKLRRWVESQLPAADVFVEVETIAGIRQKIGTDQ